MIEVIRIPQFKYHETTATWNFFILRIAIDPPATRKGLIKRQLHMTIFRTLLA